MLDAHIIAVQGIEKELHANFTKELLRELFAYLDRLLHNDLERVFDTLETKTLIMMHDYNIPLVHDNNNDKYWRKTIPTLRNRGYKFECMFVRDEHDNKDASIGFEGF